MNQLKRGLDKTIDVFNSILCAFGVVFYMTFVVCVLIQVISRNFLPNAPSWTEEMARYSFIYMVAFGCGVAVHRKEFVNVEFLQDFLKTKGLDHVNRILDVVIQATMCLFSIYLLFKAVVPFAFIKFPMFSTAMEIPMQYVYFSIVLMFSFLALGFALKVMQTLVHWNDPVEEDMLKEV